MGFMEGMEMIFEFFHVMWLFFINFWWLFVLAMLIGLLDRYAKGSKNKGKRRKR